ncbi:MAG TPA: hypothetical protein VHB25_01245 [Gemmatimonadaceae bacterium]|nr:hypothetical protein [Gemmatimonadaceae bacterium]
MMLKGRSLVAAGCLVLITACGSDSTSPQLEALNGPWSTGHTLVGLDLALSLTWTNNAVQGNGSYAIAGDTLRCGTSATSIPVNGSVTFTATRPAPDRLTGSLRFDNGASIPFDGALVDSSRINGQIPRIDGEIEAADGTKCPWGLYHALVP